MLYMIFDNLFSRKNAQVNLFSGVCGIEVYDLADCVGTGAGESNCFVDIIFLFITRISILLKTGVVKSSRSLPSCLQSSLWQSPTPPYLPKHLVRHLQ